MGKYHAIPTEVDGIRFASRMEARRYQELRLMERAGVIRNLQLQTNYRLFVNGVLICRYRPDFEYDEVATGEHVVEDCKGARTRLFDIKAKLMLACHGITVVESQA